ncbi:GDSL-type esterase/lipase family protein [Rhodobacteraceae bacterium]|nr:GDSL-type esterase/lipase family protein [Paracoccaceae bacterium]
MTKRALIYGDSNTFGSMAMPKLGAGGIFPKGERWGDVLAAGLGADWDVVIEGLGGRTSAFDDPIEGEFRNGLRILPAIIYSHRPIDLLIVALGTNDQKHRFGLRAEDVALGIARVVREALATGEVRQALVIAPPPLMCVGAFAEIFAGIDVRSIGLAQQIEAKARDLGAAFFDAGAVISVDPVDGIHWTGQAHQDLGHAMIDVVLGLGVADT